MKRRIICTLLATVMALALLAGCAPTATTTTAPSTQGGTSTSGATTTPPTTTEPAKPAREHLNTFISANPASLDPSRWASGAEHTINIQICDPLCYLDGDEVTMLLAESYDVSADSLTYTFHLRKGVKFHNGEEFKANDVVFTIERDMESPYMASYTAQIESVTAVDDYTVDIRLKAPYAPFLLSVNSLLIVNEKAVTEAGESYGEHPIGTGPYKFVSFEPSNKIELTRFDDYFRGPAAIKDVTVKILTDPTTSTIGLQTGELDIGDFSLSSYDEVVASGLQIHQWKADVIYFVTMNTEVAPFDNKLVRQAIGYAADKEFMVEVAASGFAAVSNTMIPPTVFGHSDNVTPKYETNKEKAKQLLIDAGLTLPYDIGTIKVIDGQFKQIAEILMQDLNEIGLKVEIEMLEQNKYLEDVFGGNYSMGVISLGMPGDADKYQLLFKSENINGINMARYNNPTVDDLFVQGASILDADKRLEIYKQIQDILSEDMPYVPVYVPELVFAYSQDVVLTPSDTQFNRPYYNLSWK